MALAAVFYFFWRDIQKRNAAEAVKQKQRDEEKARREAAARKARVPAPQKTRAISSPNVATPRKAAPQPTPYRRVAAVSTPKPTPAPVPSPVRIQSDDSTTDVLLGAAIGYAVGSLLSGNDDRPSHSSDSCSRSDYEPISSGGGGDFGGGGAEASWND